MTKLAENIHGAVGASKRQGGTRPGHRGEGGGRKSYQVPTSYRQWDLGAWEVFGFKYERTKEDRQKGRRKLRKERRKKTLG
ncbi:hypothetical protein L484_018604 [Morus notabilis]|uniref:Uncharacterized protein n=1 Tax=Morus notabilis TaxID=981085 RepID=W9RF75_9ROSA|nr:hypothetical protein L484_018604 [Morus notabilis]